MKNLTEIIVEKEDIAKIEDLHTIILKLKNAFREEMLAYYQYLILEHFVESSDFEAIKKKVVKDFKENAKEELEDHALWILGRLKELGADFAGIENPVNLEAFSDHKYICPKDPDMMICIDQVAEAEAAAIETYKDLVEYTEKRDKVTHKKMQSILKDEEKHLKEMDKFREEIRETVDKRMKEAAEKMGK